ncbi:MAG: GTPase Era [Anaerolineae bacterium]
MSEIDQFDQELPEDHRSGVIAVVGRPNVGKSTLINRILGEKIAIVSPKPQTTRKQQLGIYTDERVQILFVDTPGLHKPQTKLGEYMVEVAEMALKDADLILWVLDVSEEPQASDKYIAETVSQLRGQTPVVLALNKADTLNDAERETRIAAHKALVEHQQAFLVSALNGDGISELVAHLIAQMPQGPRYYPADQLSEVNMRFMAAEVVREKIILHTEQEIPHSVAVEVVEYKERDNGMHYINAMIYVERDSQKGIIIGKSGAMLKQIGVEARKELRAMLDADVYLDLHVTVQKNWRSDEQFMRRLGYRIAKEQD